MQDFLSWNLEDSMKDYKILEYEPNDKIAAAELMKLEKDE